MARRPAACRRCIAVAVVLPFVMQLVSIAFVRDVHAARLEIRTTASSSSAIALPARSNLDIVLSSDNELPDSAVTQAGPLGLLRMSRRPVTTTVVAPHARSHTARHRAVLSDDPDPH